MNSDISLLVTLRFTASSTGLITQRSLNNSWVMFIGTLLGSVFGIMGSIATLMGSVESLTGSFQKKYEDFVKVDKVNKQRMKLISNFKKEGINDETMIDAVSTQHRSKTRIKFSKILSDTPF